MELQELKLYRSLLSNLSEMDLEKRDLYLRAIHEGKIMGPLTGNIFLDKPWVVNYRDQILYDVNPNQSLYQAFKEASKDRMDEIAIYQPDLDMSYTYGEVLEMVDRAAKGFASKGLKKGDVVGVFLNNCVEEPVTLLALNKLGVISKWIDYTKDPGTIVAMVNESNLSMLVMDEMVLPLEGAINPVKKPVIVANTQRNYRGGNLISFNKLMKSGDDYELEDVEVKPEDPAVVISSSGTTGRPKPILHSNYSLNCAVRKMLYSNFELDDKHLMMKIIPPQIGLGLITSLYTSLISGTKILMIRGTSAENSIENAVDFIANYQEYCEDLDIPSDYKLIIFASPMYFRAILSNPNIQDMSFVDGMLAAGSKMDKMELDFMDGVLKDKNCNVPICNGYGQNELAGAVIINDPLHNVNGSAGYPVIGTNVVIADNDFIGANEIGQEGRILERSDSEFLEYFNHEDETKDARREFLGSEYFDTKDLGRMDEDGFVHITGRVSRVLIKFDFKIPLDNIENKVRSLPFIKDCAAIVINQGGSMEDLGMLVTLDDEYVDSMDEKEVLTRIMESGILSEMETPLEFSVIPKMPYLNNSKIDYVKLSKSLALKKH